MWLLDAAHPHIDTLRGLGVTNAYISVGYFWRDQCNLAFSQEELAVLAKMDIAFSISCYEDNEVAESDE